MPRAYTLQHPLLSKVTVLSVLGSFFRGLYVAFLKQIILNLFIQKGLGGTELSLYTDQQKKIIL